MGQVAQDAVQQALQASQQPQGNTAFQQPPTTAAAHASSSSFDEMTLRNIIKETANKAAQKAVDGAVGKVESAIERVTEVDPCVEEGE